LLSLLLVPLPLLLALLEQHCFPADRPLASTSA
jgi:hypothetical protein